ncbi:hypothetical protein BGX23_004575, partial [Mortierella sp. AD031]
LRMEKDFMKLELQNQVEKWRRVSVYWEDKWRKTANDLHEAVTSGATSDVLFEIASSNPGLLQTTATITNGASAPTSTVASPRTSQTLSAAGAQAKRLSLAISTSSMAGLIGGGASHGAGNHVEPPMTPSALKQHILESKMRSNGAANGLNRQSSSSFFQSSSHLTSSTTNANGVVTSISSPPLPSSHHPSTATLAVGAITESLTDLVSTVKPFLSRTVSQTANGISATTSSLVGGVGTGRGGSSNSHNNTSSRLAAAASLRTPIAAGLPSSVSGTGAMGNTSVSKTSIRSRTMATSVIGSARSNALLTGGPTVVTEASRDAQTRANSSISTMSRSVDQALSESDRLKADVRRMLNR